MHQTVSTKAPLFSTGPISAWILTDDRKTVILVGFQHLLQIETTFWTGRLRARQLTSFGLVARHGTILMTGIALKSNDTSNKGVIWLI